MEPLWLVVGALALIIIALFIKIRLLQKSADAVRSAFENRLAEESNALIDLPCRDPSFLALAEAVNAQLRLLREERRRFRHGDLELKDAIASVSHDLRTPLTAMLGYIELLEREDKSETVARYVERVKGRAEALRVLTDELLDYTVGASLRELKPRDTDLGRALENSLLSFYGAIERRGLEVDVNITETPVVRRLDPEALNRVFSNIIGNAVKYSDGDLSVVMDGGGRIVFSNRADGLDPLTVGKLFDRFYTVSSNRGSTGLGLSIARLLTERMGGSITARLENGRLIIELFFEPQIPVDNPAKKV